MNFRGKWSIERVYGLPHRWQWSVSGPRGGRSGTAQSEAVARARAMDEYAQVYGATIRP